LRIVDFDGKYEFSNIINIDVSAPKDLSENKTKILSLYPNPTDGKTNVEMYVHEKQADFEIKVVNILGQVMHTEHVSFSKGEVAFGVDATKYAQGEYVVVITNKSTSESFNVKLVKQ